MTDPIEPANRCTPIAEWPAGDRMAWRIALQPADLLDPTIGYANRWKPTTRRMIENGYGRWLGWLARSGNLDPAVTPVDRATHAHVGAYRDMLQAADLAPYSIAARLQQLGNALQAMSPGADRAWILRGSFRIHSSAAPIRDKTACIRPTEEVFALGIDLMQAAENDRFRTDRDRATLFRDGLLLTLLVRNPLRMANLAGIAIGRQLQRRGDVWWLAFANAETKENRPINCLWPEDLVECLDRYISIHRKVLLASSRKPLHQLEALWVSKQGTQMTTHAIAFQVNSRTEAEFGLPINPHSFRHIAATTIATADPDNATDIQCVLGHSSMKMSDKHYNRAKMVDAGLRYQATIAAKRKQT
jgi:integrase/recombinase XerD